MNPFVRWAGSKRQLVPILRERWPGGATRYVEPFCGSACLFFSVEPKSALLGDINNELTTTYKALRHDATKVVACLKKLPRGKDAYYSIRARSTSSMSRYQIAARFIYLNRFCFNGIYRTNMRGEFNVPFGRPKGPLRFDYESIIEGAKLLKRATIVNGDFSVTLARVKANDFVYLDPPYAVGNRRIFSEYHPQAFSLEDLERLQNALDRLDDIGAHFVVSYADSKEARHLMRRWNVRRVCTRRCVAGFAGHRRRAYELIASNMEVGI